MDPRVSLALTMVRQGTDRRVTVGEAASAVGLSGSRFEHLLRQETGSTFRELLRGARLSEATSLVSDLRFRIKEVAARCGYASTPCLTRAFKREFGMTPTQYRRKRATQSRGDEGQAGRMC